MKLQEIISRTNSYFHKDVGEVWQDVKANSRRITAGLIIPFALSSYLFASQLKSKDFFNLPKISFTAYADELPAEDAIKQSELSLEEKVSEDIYSPEADEKEQEVQKVQKQTGVDEEKKGFENLPGDNQEVFNLLGRVVEKYNTIKNNEKLRRVVIDEMLKYSTMKLFVGGRETTELEYGIGRNFVNYIPQISDIFLSEAESILKKRTVSVEDKSYIRRIISAVRDFNSNPSDKFYFGITQSTNSIENRLNIYEKTSAERSAIISRILGATIGGIEYKVIIGKSKPAGLDPEIPVLLVIKSKSDSPVSQTSQKYPKTGKSKGDGNVPSTYDIAKNLEEATKTYKTKIPLPSIGSALPTQPTVPEKINVIQTLEQKVAEGLGKSAGSAGSSANNVKSIVQTAVAQPYEQKTTKKEQRKEIVKRWKAKQLKRIRDYGPLTTGGHSTTEAESKNATEKWVVKGPKWMNVDRYTLVSHDKNADTDLRKFVREHFNINDKRKISYLAKKLLKVQSAYPSRKYSNSYVVVTDNFRKNNHIPFFDLLGTYPIKVEVIRQNGNREYREQRTDQSLYEQNSKTMVAEMSVIPHSVTKNINNSDSGLSCNPPITYINPVEKWMGDNPDKVEQMIREYTTNWNMESQGYKSVLVIGYENGLKLHEFYKVLKEYCKTNSLTTRNQLTTRFYEQKRLANVKQRT